jgi:hypothetical protein
MSEQQRLTVSTFQRVWVTVPTELANREPQVRYAGHNAITGEVYLEYRDQPTTHDLEARGITREESDRGVE